MTSKIDLFNPNALPYGNLSNNAITPFYRDGTLWNSVTNYVYANLLRGTNRIILKIRLYILCQQHMHVCVQIIYYL